MTTPDRGNVVWIDEASEGAPTAVPTGLEDRGISVVETDRDGGRARLSQADCAIVVDRPTGLDGLEFLRATTVDTPVVVLAADGSESLASDAVAAGAAGYVPADDRPERRLVTRVLDLLDREPDGGERSSPDHDSPDPDSPDPDSPDRNSPESPRGRGRSTTESRSGPRQRADGGVAAEQFTISEALKERAMDEAPVGITISDPSRPDNPLIYVNDAYERLTGYTADEVLGRNCRFLQGEKSDPEAIAAMREAIAAAEPVSVELVNYRKDGSEFWNKVDIAPVRNEAGEVTNYVGFQTDISARKRAEFAAQEWAEELEDLVARIEGLVSDVASLLVRAESRREIESGICRRLADSERYDAVWLGERTVVGDEVVPRAWAGSADPPESFAIAIDGGDGGPDSPVARAVETGDFETGVVAEGDGDRRWPVAGGADERGALAAIPLVYRENSYGVLVVYAADPSAFEGHEAAILEALGRTVATAIDARESKRLFAADDVVELSVEITDPGAFLVGVAADAGCRLEYDGAVDRGEGSMLLFFTAEGAPAEVVRDRLVDHPGIAAVDCLVDHGDASLFEVTVEGEGLVSLLAEYGARLVGAEIEGDGARLELEVSDADAARTVFDVLSERYDGTTLAAYRERERPPTTRREFVESVRVRLTDRQLTALQKAYVGGFFEWPHAISGDELAESMEISRPTYHQHLRAAQRKLVEAFFEV